MLRFFASNIIFDPRNPPSSPYKIFEEESNSFLVPARAWALNQWVQIFNTGFFKHLLTPTKHLIYQKYVLLKLFFCDPDS